MGVLRALPARRRLSVFLALVVCLAGSQVWLTIRWIDQDRNLELQRSHERLGEIADLAVAQLAHSLGDWDVSLHELNTLPPVPALAARLPKDATFLLISQRSVAVYPRRPLLFVPNPPLGRLEETRAFDAADELELREQQYDRALALLKPLADASGTRAEALIRIARIEHKAGHTQASLDDYQWLAKETGVNASATPYALLAATARCRILIEAGRHEEAAHEAAALRDALLQGRWPLSRESFDYYWSALDGLGIQAGNPPQADLDFANLVADLFGRWQSIKASGGSADGRVPQANSSLLEWNASPDRLSALVTSPDWLETNLKLPANSGDIHWKLLGAGASGRGGLAVTRSLAEAQIPGRLEFTSRGQDSSLNSGRRTLLLAGVALMVLMTLTAGYFIYRSVNHELRVARLQSDFVAAVSHEFRAPLTTLRTITELLAHNRITDESRRRQSYVYLDRETTRLHRLVEDLLDFGRMESGRKQYCMETHDVFALARSTVADFREQAEANGFQVQAHLDSVSASVHADEEAFRRALRNLLENAMKYSPVCRTVWVDGAVNHREVLISVRDEGMGIDAEEQQAIFQKFVRGNAAKKAGINGTGIGLAMVQQISEALGGEIRLHSELGVGSTFTLVLPLAHD